jgi:hypothetical protein
VRVPEWGKVLLISLSLFALVSVVGLWAAGQFILGDGPMARCKGHEHFDARIWRDSASTYGPLALRGCMVDDLLASGSLRGETRASVIALLGEPSASSRMGRFSLVYWLGPERNPFGVDSELLVVRVDATGRVVRYGLITD